jgi:hypothetical protein
MCTRACAEVSFLSLSYILQGDFCSHDCFKLCIAKSLLHSFPLKFSPHVACYAGGFLQVYDVIAGHFSSTRFAVWPKVRAFLESLSPGSVVADVGCGNGKYLSVRPDLAVLGCDRSAGEEVMGVARLHVWFRSAHGCACVQFVGAQYKSSSSPSAGTILRKARVVHPNQLVPLGVGVSPWS